MKAKYIIFAWVWPIFSIFLFVCAMLLVIHEGAYHNFERTEKVYTALTLLVTTFVNGWIAVLVSGHYKKPNKMKNCKHFYVVQDDSELMKKPFVCIHCGAHLYADKL